MWRLKEQILTISRKVVDFVDCCWLAMVDEDGGGGVDVVVVEDDVVVAAVVDDDGLAVCLFSSRFCWRSVRVPAAARARVFASWKQNGGAVVADVVAAVAGGESCGDFGAEKLAVVVAVD